ncbi:MAG: peptide chain release factor 1 [Anaerolineales bacterium]|uniref:Peptide chain release factor 1 n=1 Tax=Candidatus Desulfolinea nitratireducens TaxID=2841698 RepID=A0A8J6NQW7_9CHLR|nr:peptide chain release factor 1 [Candidatus Desulfolinea nitratireducens]MBL6959921.1 peptide chain release factor 1 [Anaerolineales bacterium]
MLSKLAGIEKHYEELGQQLMKVGDDYKLAANIGRERSEMETIVQKAEIYRSLLSQIEDARSMVDNETDEELRSLAEMELEELEPQVELLEVEIKSLLVPKDPRDGKNVIMEIRAGTGGDEAALFAADLYRMYTRYAENQNWKTEILSQSNIGIGGLKEITFLIKGAGVYSQLKFESGVHRVQRVPSTESQGRIHTSTATIAVLAEVADVDIQIPTSDLRIDVYKSAGAGGQSVQKNSTAIRITHLPSGLVVACQDERSQLQNKLRAMAILRARLYEIAEEERRAKIDDARRLQVGKGERSEKIRTYNYPQSRVTDHRVNISSYNLAAVMEGDIKEFIEELTTQDEADRLAAITPGSK